MLEFTKTIIKDDILPIEKEKRKEKKKEKSQTFLTNLNSTI